MTTGGSRNDNPRATNDHKVDIMITPRVSVIELIGYSSGDEWFRSKAFRAITNVLPLIIFEDVVDYIGPDFIENRRWNLMRCPLAAKITEEFCSHGTGNQSLPSRLGSNVFIYQRNQSDSVPNSSFPSIPIANSSEYWYTISCDVSQAFDV